jgi:DNA-binding CsgD family transcriptional regulator
VLENLGLSQDMQVVYSALLGSDDGALGELSRSVGMTEEDVHRAVHELCALDLVTWDGGAANPRLVNPESALKSLLSRQRAEVLDRERRLIEGQMAVERMLRAHGHLSEAPSNDVERLDGVSAVRERIVQLASTCTHSVWSFNPDGAQSRDNRHASTPLSAQTLDRGVEMRSIYLDSVRNDAESTQHIVWLCENGAQVRLVPFLPMRMIIVDQESALVPIDVDDSASGAFVVSGSGLVAGLVALFLATWRAAQPFGVRRPRRIQSLSEQERNALVLWGQGATDGVVARRLGVSERTVRRISENIADRLGARSRFELGVRASQLGWLTTDDVD